MALDMWAEPCAAGLSKALRMRPRLVCVTSVIKQSNLLSAPAYPMK